jgi:hypothetical protein
MRHILHNNSVLMIYICAVKWNKSEGSILSHILRTNTVLTLQICAFNWKQKQTFPLCSRYCTLTPLSRHRFVLLSDHISRRFLFLRHIAKKHRSHVTEFCSYVINKEEGAFMPHILHSNTVLTLQSFAVIWKQKQKNPICATNCTLTPFALHRFVHLCDNRSRRFHFAPQIAP